MYSKRLIELRKEEQIRQIELANKLGIHRARYSMYETETEIIPIKHLILLADYFNVSIDYLFEFSNNKNYKDYNKSIDTKLSGVRLKNLRKEQKLTQTEFGEVLKCSYGTIAGYESGRYPIATPFLYDICKKYKISADYLLGRSNIQNSQELNIKK